MSIESEAFPLLTCLNATKIVLLSIFTLIETICKKNWAKSLPMSKKGHFRLTCVGPNRFLLRFTNIHWIWNLRPYSAYLKTSRPQIFPKVGNGQLLEEMQKMGVFVPSFEVKRIEYRGVLSDYG